jgi:hypothetical protein
VWISSEIHDPESRQALSGVVYLPIIELAEASLALWDSLEVQVILQIFCRQVFPLIHPSLLRTSKEHWSASVRQSVMRALAFKIVFDDGALTGTFVEFLFAMLPCVQDCHKAF